MSGKSACKDACNETGYGAYIASTDLPDAAENECLDILHVDDELAILDITKEIIELEGNFRVDRAKSVDDAFNKLKHKSYDLIISDYEMPGKDGLNFLKELRQTGNKTPVIIFTGKGREEVAVKALNLGAYRYINKHGDPQVVYKELSSSIVQVCDRVNAHKKLLKSEKQFRQLFSNMPSGVAVYEAVNNGEDFAFVDLNKAAEKIDQVAKNEIVGRKVTEAFPGVKDIGLFAVFQRVWRTGKPEHLPAAIYNDGSDSGVWRENWVFKLPNGNLVAIYNDVTACKKAETVLKQSQKRFRELADALPEMVYEADTRGVVVYMNQRGYELTGYTEQYLKKEMRLFDLFSPVDSKKTKSADAALSGPLRGEFWVKKNAGDLFPVVLESVPVFSEGKVAGVRGVAIDLTEIKHKEKLLESKAQECQKILDGINDWLFVIDKNHVIKQVNKSFYTALKKKPEDLIGKHCYEVVHGTNKPWATCPAVRTFATNTIQAQEVLDDKIGIPLNVITTPLQKQDNESPQCVHIAQDITPQKETQETLKNTTQEKKCQEEEIAALLQGTYAVLKHPNYKDAIRVIFESCKNLTKAAAGHIALLSKANSDSKVIFSDSGKLGSIFDPDPSTPIKALQKQAYQTRQAVYQNDFSKNKKRRASPKSPQIDNVLFAPLVIENEAVGVIELVNKPGGFTNKDAAIARAFGEYAAIAVNNNWNWESINKKEALLRAITSSAADAIILIDAQGKAAFWSPAAEKMFGYTEKEMLGKIPHLFLTPKKVHKLYQKQFKQFQSSPNQSLVSPSEVLVKNKEGTEFYVEFSLSSFQFDGKWHAVEIIRDITERKKAEAEIAYAKEKFRMYVENSPVAVFVANVDGSFEYANEAAYNLLGYPNGQLVGMFIPQVLFDEDVPAALKNFNDVKEDGHSRIELSLRTKDRKHVYVTVNSVRLPDGKIMAFCENITELKNAEKELRANRDQMQMMNEKLRVVGSLTRHDVRNKLVAVAGNAYLIKRKNKDQPDTIERLTDMEQAVKDINRIFDFTKMYEQLGVENLTVINVAQTIDEAIALFPALPDLDVKNKCQGLNLLADSFLRQLFYNLIDNSKKHGKHVKNIQISYEKTPDDNLLLIYQDDGAGITEENKKNLFKEGFSTAGSTGYGLHLIKKMIEVYGWTIQETGTPGKGAKFVITIPQTNLSGKENYQIQT
ncbi:MAG: PAS domain S-box protein [Candidatus Bathyarchaeota archaeon]|nr:PAS domain S-box protein [Candidatus Bathyarchaeota archaeon]